KGAAALKGFYQVIFSANLNDDGAIEIQMQDHELILLNVIGLAWQDSVSGQTTFFASVKDCVGEIIEPNQVIYRDAFDGILADVRYIYNKGKFESDIILREQPVLPRSLPADRAHLQVVTEFLSGPEPRIA